LARWLKGAVSAYLVVKGQYRGLREGVKERRAFLFPGVTGEAVDEIEEPPNWKKT
jgi:hypothetical protein